MESKMKAPLLAKKLRARMADLKKQRERDLVDHDRLFEKWKGDVARWLRTEPQKLIPSIKKNDLEDRRYGCHTSLPSYVFKDIPKPPTKPSDDAIREIQKTLRYIAFTGTPTVTVSQRQLDEWFGKDEASDD